MGMLCDVSNKPQGQVLKENTMSYNKTVCISLQLNWLNIRPRSFAPLHNLLPDLRRAEKGLKVKEFEEERPASLKCSISLHRQVINSNI
jgi:hypothetical protein